MVSVAFIALISVTPDDVNVSPFRYSMPVSEFVSQAQNVSAVIIVQHMSFMCFFIRTVLSLKCEN